MDESRFRSKTADRCVSGGQPVKVLRVICGVSSFFFYYLDIYNVTASSS